jgi:hypothetical protein
LSIYSYFNCHTCQQTLWLGKAVWDQGDQPSYFHIGDANRPPYWKREQLNQVLWKFLAAHTAHHIDVRLEHEMSEEMWDYQNVGGDRNNDISFEQYLDGWHGL